MKTISEMKTTLDEIISWLDIAEEMINEPEDTAIETTQNEIQREKVFKIWKKGISELWENFKWSNICVTGVSEKEEGQKKYLKK